MCPLGEARHIRILVLSAFPPEGGGGELQTQVQLAEMVRRKHHVTVIDIRHRHGGPPRETVEGIEVVRIRTPRWPVIGGLVYHARIAAQVTRLAGQVDVAQFNHIGAGLFFAVPILKLHGVPCAVVIWGSAAPGVGPFGEGWRNRLARGLARHLDCFVSLAALTTDNLARHGFDTRRVRLIPNAVDNVRFCPVVAGEARSKPSVLPDSGPIVMTVGRLVSAKGLDVLLEAWGRVSSGTPSARLVIVGEGPLRHEVERWMGDLQVQDSVRLIGKRTDIPELLRQADVYVSASRTEGMSNALLEALCTGLAAVATRVGAAEDLIEDGVSGLLVAPGSARELAQALERLIVNPPLRSSLGGSARLRAMREYSIDSVVDRYIALYREMIGP